MKELSFPFFFLEFTLVLLYHGRVGFVIFEFLVRSCEGRKIMVNTHFESGVSPTPPNFFRVITSLVIFSNFPLSLLIRVCVLERERERVRIKNCRGI